MERPAARQLRWIVVVACCALALSGLGPQGACAEDLTLAPPAKWLVVASTMDVDEAIGIAGVTGPEARVVQARNGRLAVVYGPTTATLQNLAPDVPMIPGDAFLTDGTEFEATVWQSSRPAVSSVDIGKNATVDLALAGGVSLLAKRQDKDLYYSWTVDIEIRKGSEILGRLEHEFTDVSDFNSTIQAVELYPFNDLPEIVVNAYTGGAHCCTVYAIFVQDRNGAWKTFEFGQFDGGGIWFEDAGPLRTPHILVSDDRFDYAFASYAESFNPIRIYKLGIDGLDEVTADPDYVSRHRQELGGMEFMADNSPGYWDNQGFLAAWVAEKARVGEYRDAMERLPGLYAKVDKSFYVGFGIDRCLDDTPVIECPQDRRESLPFPEGVKVHLQRNGYIPDK